MTLSAPPYPGKSPELLPLGDGLNFSTPLAQVQGTVVPSPLFFLRSNNPVPDVTSTTWRMRIEGRVRNAFDIDLAGLQALPSEQHEVWLECAGNSRTRFDPQAEGNQWDDQAVSNAVFTGTPLFRLLERAGVEDDAIELVTTGADNNFQRGLPLDVAFSPQTLLVWDMNGAPLPTANGGPVRLLVPGWAGIASVKWPVKMETVNKPFDGYYNAQRYIWVDREGRTLRTIREMPVKSVIAWPAAEAAVPAGAHTVFGFAWSGHGPIARVEVSVDGQRTWSAARLQPGRGPLAWTRWELPWTPPAPGRFTISVRATDAQGNTQPAAAAWNKFGYEMNGILSREVTVN